MERARAVCPAGRLAPLPAEFFVSLVTAFAEVRAICTEFALGALIEGFGAHHREHANALRSSSGASRVRASSTRMDGVPAKGLLSTPFRKDMMCCVKNRWFLLPIAAGAEFLCESRGSVIS